MHGKHGKAVLPCVTYSLCIRSQDGVTAKAPYGKIVAYYGLRRCEILGLKWDAVDFQNKTLSVQHKVVSDYDENGKMHLYVESRLKTNATRRTLPLIPHIEQMLLEKKQAEANHTETTDFDGFICRDHSGNI